MIDCNRGFSILTFASSNVQPFEGAEKAIVLDLMNRFAFCQTVSYIYCR